MQVSSRIPHTGHQASLFAQRHHIANVSIWRAAALPRAVSADRNLFMVLCRRIALVMPRASVSCTLTKRTTTTKARLSVRSSVKNDSHPAPLLTSRLSRPAMLFSLQLRDHGSQNAVAV